MSSAKGKVSRDGRTSVFGEFCQRRRVRGRPNIKVNLCLAERVIARRNNCIAIRSRIKGKSTFSVFLPEWEGV